MKWLLRPAPLPDELDHGYLGRIIRINGFKYEKDAVAETVRMFDLGRIPKWERSLSESLSLVAGQSLEEFVMEHSLIPIRRAIAANYADLPHGSPTRRAFLRFFGKRTARPSAFFCRACVSADVEFHGVSYWRREHQLPGHFWCPKHSTPLMFMKEKEAFLQAPSKYSSLALTVPHECFGDALNNSCVGKFMGIMSGLMERERPMHVKYVTLALRTQAASRGLQTYVGLARKPLLSDLILDSYPRNWLGNVLPDLVKKTPGQILKSVDGVLAQQDSLWSVSSYVAAAAVLYGSADEALNKLFHASQTYGKACKLQTLSRPIFDSEVSASACASSPGLNSATDRQLIDQSH